MELVLIKDDLFPVFDGKVDFAPCTGCNFVVDNGNFELQDIDLFNGQLYNLALPTHDMYDILVWLGVFQSKGQASKNWTKTGKAIPDGWSEFYIGKGKKDKFGLFIWNPTKKASEYTEE